MGSIKFTNVEHLEPDQSLKPYVKFYLNLTFEAPDFPLWIPADRRNQLLILKQGKVQVNTKSSTYFQAPVSVRACFDSALDVKFKKGTVEVIVIEFTAIGLHVLFGIDMESYLNKIEALSATLLGFDDVNDSRFRSKLDHILLNKLKIGETKYADEIAQAIIFAEKCRGKCDRSEVVEHVGLNPKTFYRYFRKFTGLSPKKYFTLIQFEASLVEIIKNEKVDKMDLLAESGYYDQSHFIKAIQKFSGCSPDKIKNLDSSWIQFLIENNLYH